MLDYLYYEFIVNGSVIVQHTCVNSPFENLTVCALNVFIAWMCLRCEQAGLKSDSNLPKKFIFISFNKSPLKIMKNAFFFTLKALFVLKIFKFLS